MDLYHPAIPPRFQIAAYEGDKALKKVPLDVRFMVVDLEQARKVIESACAKHNMMERTAWDIFFGLCASHSPNKPVLFIDRLYILSCEGSIN